MKRLCESKAFEAIFAIVLGSYCTPPGGGGKLLEFEGLPRFSCSYSLNSSRRFSPLPRRCVDTGAIAAADDKRDRLFKAIYFALEQLSQIDGDLPLAVKARTVFNILAAYKGNYSQAITKATEELQGLSFDIMKTPAAVEALTGLGLLPWFNALAAANEEVDSLYQHRTGERADREHDKGEGVRHGGKPQNVILPSKTMAEAPKRRFGRFFTRRKPRNNILAAFPRTTDGKIAFWPFRQKIWL